jgi:hypothetical protein
VYAGLYDRLPQRAAELRTVRVADQPACFWYEDYLSEHGQVVRLRFRVGNVGWPDELWVVEVERLG